MSCEPNVLYCLSCLVSVILSSFLSLSYYPSFSFIASIIPPVPSIPPTFSLSFSSSPRDRPLFYLFLFSPFSIRQPTLLSLSLPLLYPLPSALFPCFPHPVSPFILPSTPHDQKEPPTDPLSTFFLFPIGDLSDPVGNSAKTPFTTTSCLR